MMINQEYTATAISLFMSMSAESKPPYNLSIVVDDPDGVNWDRVDKGTQMTNIG